jgi:hypothetical protein
MDIKRHLDLGTPPNNEVYENADGVSNYGGTCTCPDLKVYQVGA